MKSLSAAVVALCSVASLAWAPHAEAGGNHSIRADLPCPYGGAGPADPNAWSATTGASPYNPGLLTPNTATLVGGSNITTDQSFILGVQSAIQYVYYSSPIDPSICASNAFGAPGPMEQVIQYTMADNTGVTQAGDIEVAFNYDLANTSLATTAGNASFTLDGVTYKSTGTVLPTAFNDEFLFSSTGALKGELVTDTSGNVSLKAGVPDGWTSSTGSGGGGGGTMTVPEIDASSAAAGLTLLAGVLMVLRGGRRSLKVSR
jgi:hypothetical protein